MLALTLSLFPIFTSRLHASNAVYHYEGTDLGTDSWQEHGLVSLAFILLNFYCVQKPCLCRKLSFDFARWWRYLKSFSCVPNILDAKIRPFCVDSICFYIGILPVTENPHIANRLSCFWVIASSEICSRMQAVLDRSFWNTVLLDWRCMHHNGQIFPLVENQPLRFQFIFNIWRLKNIPKCILFDKSRVLGGWWLVLLGGEF